MKPISVFASSSIVALCFSIVTLCSSVSAQVIFTETFDDGAAATRWSAPIIEAENGVFDGSVDFAFDYSSLGVPAAPGGDGSTLGLFMEVNTTDAEGDEGESVGTLAGGLTLPDGYFELSMDVYWNVNNLTNTDTGEAPGGTTEYGLFGVFASGPLSPDDESVNDDIPFRFNLSNGDGLTFSATGEGGAANDIYLFQDPGNAGTGSQSALTSYDDIPNGSIPGVPSGAGDPANPFAFGPEDQWVEMTITSTGDMVTFAMNGYVFEDATIDNSAGTYSGGTIMLGYSDPFNSVNLDVGSGPSNFILFDNVTLTVPEPNAGMMLLAGPIVLLAIRRRR